MKFNDFLLAEEKNDTAVFTFGRFQPPTRAHEKLIKQVGSLAKEKGAHPFVFTSRKSGDKKNPLPFEMKSGMIRKHFGVNVPDSEEISNPFQAAQHLGKLGYKNVHLVLGGDRVKDIGGMIKKYMGHEDPEKRIDISNLTLHSAGDRSVDKVSGTSVRAAARSGNVEAFRRMIAPSLGDKSSETLYRVLRGEQQLGESLDNPFPTKYKKERLYDIIQHSYNFQMPPEGEQKKGKTGKVVIAPTFQRGHYDVEFDVDDRDTPTGAGNTAKIFSTVASALDQHMKKYPKTKGIEAIIPADQEYKMTDKGEKVPSGRAKLYKRLANRLGKKYGFDVEADMELGVFKGTRKKAPKLAEEVKRDPNRTGPRTGLGSTKLIGVPDPKTGKIKIRHVFANEPLPDDIKKALQKEEANPRIPRKKGQPAKSKKHSDLYTDEDPKGTIHGLGFKNASVARASVRKIESSSRSHAHKIQAAVAMEQRARVANKDAAAAIYRRYIDRNKKSK